MCDGIEPAPDALLEESTPILRRSLAAPGRLTDGRATVR